jgi:hypothetical protein
VKNPNNQPEKIKMLSQNCNQFQTKRLEDTASDMRACEMPKAPALHEAIAMLHSTVEGLSNKISDVLFFLKEISNKL